MTKLKLLWSNLRSRLWFLPSLIVAFLRLAIENKTAARRGEYAAAMEIT